MNGLFCCGQKYKFGLSARMRNLQWVHASDRECYFKVTARDETKKILMVEQIHIDGSKMKIRTTHIHTLDDGLETFIWILERLPGGGVTRYGRVCAFDVVSACDLCYKLGPTGGYNVGREPRMACHACMTLLTLAKTSLVPDCQRIVHKFVL